MNSLWANSRSALECSSIEVTNNGNLTSSWCVFGSFRACEKNDAPLEKLGEKFFVRV
jgi:hypothetical protein